MGQRLVASAQLDLLPRDPYILDQHPQILLPEARSRIVQTLPERVAEGAHVLLRQQIFRHLGLAPGTCHLGKNLLAPCFEFVRPLRQHLVEWEQTFFNGFVQFPGGLPVLFRFSA
jgi:hypothetical protein